MNCIMKTNRESTVVRTSITSILANLVLVAFKAAVGFMSNSIAIITDAVNNLSDALSSIITIIGTKLAGREPDKNHPFGHGRIEYVTSLTVSAIVLYAGFTALIESGKKLFDPETPDYTAVTITVLVAGIIVKFILGLYVKKVGKRVHSDSLIASGTDAFNDALLSISVLASAIIYMILQIDLEAFVGIFVSLYIIKAGIDLIRKSISDILGVRAESALSHNIKKEVAKDPDVEGAYDLILTDYGPDKYLASIHIEVPDTLTVADVDKISRRLTKTILAKYGVLLHTIGVYSVNTKDKSVIKIQQAIRDIVFSHKGILEMHGFYLDKTNKTITFDIVIDFAIKDRGELCKRIYDEIQSKYPDYTTHITLDVDAND